MTGLILVALFLAFVATYLLCFLLGTRIGAGKPGAIHNNSFTCPYCRIDVVSPRDLDIINHVLCIDRAKEDFERLRLEAKTVEVVDEYFVDARTYTANGRHNLSVARQPHAYMNSDLQYQVNEAIIYRNGEPIKTVHAKSNKSVMKFAEREITIDKQRRKAKK